MPLSNRLLFLLLLCSVSPTLQSSEIAYIDIHYGDEFVGAALAEFDDTHIRFESPDEIIRFLPEVIDREYLEQYFSSAIPYQQPASCTSEIYQRCFLDGKSKVVSTFDSALFLAKIYLAPEILVTYQVDVEKYLPTFKSSPSYLASFGGAYSASRNDVLPVTESYNATLTQVVSSGNKRFVSELGYANSKDFYVREASFTGEARGTRVKAGRYELQGDSLLPSRLIRGFGIHSTTDLRLDLDQNGGSRIELFIPQRSRVELYRDGRLLSAEYYEVGNQQLDISRLPDGAYDLDIKVIANGVVIDEQTQFFTKSTKLPPVGESQTSFDIGRIATPLEVGVESDSEFIRLGHSVRLNDPGFVQVTALSTRNWTALQNEYSWVMRDSIGRAGLQVADDGFRAFTVAASKSFERDLVSVDWARASVPTRESGQVDHLRRFSEDADISSLRYVRGGTRWNVQSAVRFISTEAANERVTSISAHVFPIEGNDQLKISGSTLHSTRAGFQLSIDFLWRTSVKSNTVWARSRWVNQNGQRVLSAVGLAGSRIDALRNTALRYDAAFEEYEDSRNFGAGAYYRNQLITTDSNLNIENGGLHNRSLSTNIRSAFAYSDGKVKLFSESGARAGIVVSLPDRDDSNVTVIINESRRVTIAAGSTQFIPLEAYERYKVRVQPTSGANLEYDMRDRHIVLYPGHVPVMEWRGNRVVAVFGEVNIAALEEGAAVNVVTSRGRDRAENAGYFVADVASDSQALQFTHNGEVVCEVAVDIEAANDGLLDLGLVSCR